MSGMNGVLEYLFFTRKMADEFIMKLTTSGLEYAEEIEPMQGAIVGQPPNAQCRDCIHTNMRVFNFHSK